MNAKQLTQVQQDFMQAPMTNVETKETVSQLVGWKALSPDGLQVGLYKSYRSHVRNDIQSL